MRRFRTMIFQDDETQGERTRNAERHGGASRRHREQLSSGNDALTGDWVRRRRQCARLARGSWPSRLWREI